MITIDCSAKERLTVHSIILAFVVAANQKKNPHQLDLYGTWDPLQVPSNVDSPKWLYETQDLIHEELLQQFMRETINLNCQRNLQKDNTNHARSYSQISASPLPTFLQSWQHLPLRNNDCWTETWAKHPPTKQDEIKNAPKVVLTHILSPEVRK